MYPLSTSMTMQVPRKKVRKLGATIPREKDGLGAIPLPARFVFLHRPVCHMALDEVGGAFGA